MAGFLDYGTGKGLAVAHDWAKDTENLFQSEALRARARQEKEQKTAYFAKQLQEGKAVAPVNTKRLEDFYVQHNKKVADFVIKNPNFETDVVKMKEFIDLTDEYLNNDIIREDQQVQDEFSKLKGAINHGDLRENEQFAEMQRYNDYKDGKTTEPYIFVKPQRANVQETIFNIAKNLPTTTYTVKNEDGSENQVRKVKFEPGENYETVAKSMLEGDPEYKWQIETGYNSSPMLKQLYATPALYLAKELEQKADLYNVRSNMGTSGEKPLYPDFQHDVLDLFDNMDPEAEYQVLGPSNPNLIALTSAGDTKGYVPIRAGGENFDFVSNQNDENNVPKISKIHIRHNMRILQTYEPISVKGILKTRSYVQIEIPFGGERLTDAGKSEYYDVNTGMVISKESKYGISPNNEQNTEWNKLIKDNQASAEQIAVDFAAAGLGQKKSIKEGYGMATGVPSLHPPMIYEGTILQDLNVNAQSLKSYQNQFNTDTQMNRWGDEFNITNMLNKNINNPEAFIALSKQNPYEAANVVKNELMKNPTLANNIDTVVAVPDKPWLYTITSPSGKDAIYNMRTKKYN